MRQPWGAGALLAAGSALWTMVHAKENAPGTTGLLEATVGGKRTLVLADGPRIQDSHSMFFDALEVCAYIMYDMPAGYILLHGNWSFECVSPT